MICTVRSFFTKTGSVSKVTSNALPIIFCMTLDINDKDSSLWENISFRISFYCFPLLKNDIYLFLLLKDHYFMFLASLVQDYYPDIFPNHDVKMDTGLKTAVFFSCFENTIYFIYIFKYYLLYILILIYLNS